MQSGLDKRAAGSIWMITPVPYLISAEKVASVKGTTQRSVEPHRHDTGESEKGRVPGTSKIQDQFLKNG